MRRLVAISLLRYEFAACGGATATQAPGWRWQHRDPGRWQRSSGSRGKLHRLVRHRSATVPSTYDHHHLGRWLPRRKRCGGRPIRRLWNSTTATAALTMLAYQPQARPRHSGSGALRLLGDMQSHRRNRSERHVLRTNSIGSGTISALSAAVRSSTV